MNYPQCKTENGLLKHLATWEEYLTKNGTELQQTPATLRVMLLNILPKEISDQLRPKMGKYPTFQNFRSIAVTAWRNKENSSRPRFFTRPREAIGYMR